MHMCKIAPGAAYKKTCKRTCVICGGTFYATSHYVMACYEHRDEYYKQQAKKRKLEARVTTCSVCGLSYVPQRNDSKYCSDRCKQAAYRARKTKKSR